VALLDKCLRAFFYQHSRRATASRVARLFCFLRRYSSVNSSQNGSEISEVRDFVATLSQVVVAVVSARLALFVFEVGFGYGETPRGMPVGSEIALDAILGVILLLGAGLGLVSVPPPPHNPPQESLAAKGPWDLSGLKATREN